MSISSTRTLLKAWGLWGGRRVGTELPAVSPMFALRVKSSINGAYEVAEDILACEKAVCQLEKPERNILIIRYQRQLFPADMAVAFDVSRAQAYRYLEKAEWSVHVQLGY